MKIRNLGVFDWLMVLMFFCLVVYVPRGFGTRGYIYDGITLFVLLAIRGFARFRKHTMNAQRGNEEDP